MSKPYWLKRRVKATDNIFDTVELLRELNLNTVCVSAECPNLCECFSQKTATFMILGSKCTRNCRFCAVESGRPDCINSKEAKSLAEACMKLRLEHVVITSVTRDDLIDGGASHFINVMDEIRKHNPITTIELLIPDLQGNWKALKAICDMNPEILNHNIETVPGQYSRIRPGAVYERSLALLKRAKEFNKNIYTKSGLILGFGETEKEVLQVMDDLVKVNCDILTLSQYLRPSTNHVEVVEYIHPHMFDYYKEVALNKGFRFVASGSFVRSSYKAKECIELIRNSKEIDSMLYGRDRQSGLS